MYVKIDEEIIGSLKIARAARLLGISHQALTGSLVYLWTWAMRHASDGIIKNATFDDLDHMMGMPPNAADSPQTNPGSLTKILVQTDLLRLIDPENVSAGFQIPNWFERSGKYFLEKKDDAERKLREREKGREAKRTEKQSVKPEACVPVQKCPPDIRKRPAESCPRLDQIRSEEIRSDSYPNSDRQKNSEALAEAPSRSADRKVRGKGLEGSSDGSEVWKAYSASMQAAWSMKPPSSAKNYSQAKKLVELVGKDTALALASYYPTRRSAWYVQKGHPFGLLLTDYMALMREMSGGIKLTKEIVEDISKEEDSENYSKWREIQPPNPMFMDAEEKKQYWIERKAKENADLLTEGDNQNDVF